MRTFTSIAVGKTIQYLTRKLKVGGGSAAPGLYALKIDPQLVSKLAKNIPINIVITGTNGKTTTARMIAHIASKSGLKVIRNHTGSNLERGIASTLINGVNLSHPRGVMSRHLGIWELDEAAFNSVAPKLKPQIVVFLNAFRDQLDRYGEVDMVVKKWCETLKKLDKKTVVILNGDDANTCKLVEFFGGKVVKFGLREYKLSGEGRSVKRKLDVEAKKINFKGLGSVNFELDFNRKSFSISLKVIGIYNIYNVVASLITSNFLNINSKEAIRNLRSFTPAFGRFEKFSFQPPGVERRVDGFILLIKNPTGATEVFKALIPQIKKGDALLLALNDNFADGRDVSWIWDAEFERFSKKVKGVKIILSGTRAYDLAIRLKYADVHPALQIIDNDYDLKEALEEAVGGQKGRTYILPTYTAMLDLQRILTNKGLKRHYWEED